MPLRFPAVLLLALAVVAGGCDGTTDNDFTSQLVVSAFLGTGEPLPSIRLSRTLPLLDVYTPEAAAVNDAEVTVTLLAADGSDEAVYPYTPTNTLGIYVPAGVGVEVLERRTYRLDVVGADGERLTATTQVPPDYALLDGPSDETIYGEGQGPEVRITRTSTPERQAAFVASARALAPDDFEEVTVDGETRYRSRNLPGRYLPVPIYRRFLGCEEEASGSLLCEEDPRQEGVVAGTSPVINEASYIALGDGTLLVQIPFLAFGYYGPQSISLVSLDRAMQDFVQTQLVQGGGSTLSPGEIPNITTNVEGGLGVFGSFSRETVTTTIVPAAN